MLLSEFKRKINKAEKLLFKTYTNNWNMKINYLHGVCCVLDTVFNMNYEKGWQYPLFSDFMEPDTSRGQYWLGDRNKENAETRQVALRLFEQAVIDNQIYRVM